MEACSSKVTKCLLVFINMIFFIGGVVMAGLAGYGAFNKGSALHDMVTQTKSTVLLDGLYVLFAIGLFLAMLSLIGCWGAMGESKCLLYTYFVVMLIIFLIQMSGIIVCFVKYEAIKAFILKTLHGNIQPNPSNLHTIATQLAAQTMFGKFEAKFHCCGFNGPKDYNGNPPAACYSTAVHGRRKRATNSSATVVSPTLAAIVATVTAKPATTKAVVVPVVTTTPKVATTAPKVATTAPKVATTAPKVATTAPKVATTAPKVATTAPNVATTAPNVATTAPKVATTAHQPGTTAQATTHAAVTPAGTLYTKGCVTVMKPYLYAAGGVAIVILIMEILVLILSCCMISSINAGYTPV